VRNVEVEREAAIIPESDIADIANIADIAGCGRILQ
jgi:hypothetical protein